MRIKCGLGPISRHGKKQLRNYENMNSLKLIKMPLLNQKWLKKLKGVELYQSSKSQQLEDKKRKKKQKQDSIEEAVKFVYFLVKYKIAHTTVFAPLVDLLIGDDPDLKQFFEQDARKNAQYRSTTAISELP